MYVQPIDRNEGEALLVDLGFRYYPDPMGRLDQGRWRDEEGRELEGRAPEALAGELLLVADEKNKKRLRGTRNPKVEKAVRRGLKAHEKLKKMVDGKPGWDNNPKLHEKATSSNLRPDVRTKKGRYLEFKPDTESGRQKGRRQTQRYRDAPGEGGEKIRVKPMHHRPTIGGGFRLRPRFKGIKPLWLRRLWLP
jgi:hypothetical protein